MDRTIANRIECLLFVSGEPLPVSEIARVLDMNEAETRALLFEMERIYAEEGRGIRLHITDASVQLVSNRDYAEDIEKLLQPEQTRSAGQSIMETLAIIAYKQPVTRADIEAVRGVRCEYAVSQLQKMGFIETVGRKDCAGKPMLFGTTDKFLHKFGLHSLTELPDYLAYSEDEEGDSSLI
ncbi:MAG: SMC-Scp complex subunit ScpB [Clostridia bacterium]|nr:SMC-Scp complex subunit ScpB [Clostridia bacterium]